MTGGPAVRALVAGPAAQRALRDGRSGAVELAFSGGGYLRLGADAILLAPPRAPVGPLSLLVSGIPRRAVIRGAPARVTGDALVIGEVRIALAGVRVSRPPQAQARAACWRAALHAALDVTAAPAEDLAAGLAALAAGRLRPAVTELAGRGPGLTPEGDDVLAGFAAWRWADRSPVALAADRCAPLGRAYLRCAERGELPDPAAQVMAAIRAGDVPAARRRAGALRVWGASSGAALLWGMAAGAGVDAWGARVRYADTARGRPDR